MGVIYLLLNRFQDSGDCLKNFSGDMKDKEILVPLTGSMYVPGTLTDPQRVIVDVGTGYFVEKNVSEAKEYFNRKVKFVTEQMEKVQVLGNDKSRVREAILEVMEAKVQMQMAQQRAASGAAASE
jgi:prefoldin alpha subunit